MRREYIASLSKEEAIQIAQHGLFYFRAWGSSLGHWFQKRDLTFCGRHLFPDLLEGPLPDAPCKTCEGLRDALVERAGGEEELNL